MSHSAATGKPRTEPATLRPAAERDIEALLALEARCFETDRLSRRSFRRFINRDRADCTLAVRGGQVLGYALTLFRAGTALARLYSMAVDEQARGQGIGRLLLGAAERAAVERDCFLLRLEVRPDNAAAIALYREAGFRQFDRLDDFYEDHTDALRLQKALRVERPGVQEPPYYPQSTDFTCGPAALMMAMAALDPGRPLTRRAEIRLWREATTVYMSAGHGGCEPVGLAVAAARRGFDAAVHVNQPPPFFLDSVRDPDKRAVMTLAQEEFGDEAELLGVPIQEQPLSMNRLREALDSGLVALVLVSHYRLTGSRVPHWILVFGHDGRRAYVHDPWTEGSEIDVPRATAGLPIPWAELDRMARYGRRRLQAVILLGRRAEA